jgi:hypothetical protein
LFRGYEQLALFRTSYSTDKSPIKIYLLESAGSSAGSVISVVPGAGVSVLGTSIEPLGIDSSVAGVSTGVVFIILGTSSDSGSEAAGVSVSVPAAGVSVSVPAAGVSVSVPAAGVSVSVPAAGVSVSVPAAGVSVSVPAAGVSVSVSVPAAGVSIVGVSVAGVSIVGVSLGVVTGAGVSVVSPGVVVPESDGI